MAGSKTKQVFKNLCAMSLAVGIGGAALAALPTNAAATIFSGSFVVNAHTSGNGLLIDTYALGGGSFTTPDIIEGATHSFNLFKIWTEEESINWGEDTKEKNISVQFTFTTPSYGGTVNGNTVGITSITKFYQAGQVTWDGPLTLNSPGGGDSALEITLSNATFNEGDWWELVEGKKYGATIAATFTNKADPTPAPEPATLAILSMGLASLGWAARRRKHMA